MRTKPSKSSTRSSTKAKNTRTSGTPLYVHIPFCASKCHYCDFNSYAQRGRAVTKPYLDALYLEIERRASWQPRTIFFGGGTPSILEPDEITELLDRLDALTGFRGATEEISFECNPESLTQEKARALRDGGVNRISIGMQSFRPEILKFYDRAHDATTARNAFRFAREAGFDSINLDLIFGAPGQTLEQWEEDLAEGLKLEPDHIAAYDLIFEEGTVLQRMKLLGRTAPNAEELQAQMYKRTMQIVEGAGLRRYETSNYARPGKECRHNINYWKNAEYIGLGAGAVSYVGGARWKNPAAPQAYIDAVLGGEAMREEEERLAPREKLGETMMLRLRLREGVSRAEVAAQTGFDPGIEFKEELLSLESDGLVRTSADRIELTPHGLLLGDLVASRFL